jgi:hypothetical protein
MKVSGSMNIFLKIVVFVIAVAGLWLLVTFGVDDFYEGRVHEKAFHCTDDCGFGLFTSMNSHQAAGDTLCPGWTWDKIEAVRLVYERVFYALWLGGSSIIFLLLFFRSRKNKGCDNAA